MGSVVVADRLFERQYQKTVIHADGHAGVVPRGELPAYSDRVIARQGEPAFSLRLDVATARDRDIPADVVTALRRVADRWEEFAQEHESSGGVPHGVLLGPRAHAGSIVLLLDTDGAGASPAVLDLLVGAVVEELERLDIAADLSVPEDLPVMVAPSSLDRDEGAQGPSGEREADVSHQRVVDDSARDWIVVRPVLATTTDGKYYYECQYWSSSDEWSMERSSAQVWDESPDELVIDLRRVARTQEVREPYAVHLTRGQDPWRFPSKSKRTPLASRDWPK